ncbi:uncharacterized protein [Physcomitrium patens]|uniref:Histone deacetylase complex subunit SAP30 Sin3 binding domain-containing protein n=1 Tax=Physcomitrium patens TaxID=3218 RepID=A0A2K1ITH9_PHYPA|nr:uncharacterized protein LOC112273550 isoform X1 [Physcomitrium patens]XP_024358237.1 uncharacterized protein LOC112273550 isoform X1 [Physcomitrium patens]PNR32585.1 hypothetical protein PHYPA_024527 [Physcomitrium patens]|eukprot:XP_024358236.1 uncharacterized protein LOC112273550 isoform X1 [Physcomitrella patens]
MLDTEEGPPAVHYRSGEDSGEEGLAVLPRHTKVLVTGNNRTKSVLVGLHGVVTKAVGLGGWHWLVLTNGDEVKLQRNALSVIEAPSGHEEHDENEDNPFSSGTSLEDNIPRNAFKPRVQPRKPSVTNARNASITDEDAMATEHANFSRMFERRDEVDEGSSPISAVLPSVDLSKLEVAALKRYRRHFKLVEVGPNSTKEQLLHAVGRHFMSQELDETQVISAFMQAAKRPRS